MRIKPKETWSKEDTRRIQKAADKFHSGEIRYDELEEVDYRLELEENKRLVEEGFYKVLGAYLEEIEMLLGKERMCKIQELTSG